MVFKFQIMLALEHVSTPLVSKHKGHVFSGRTDTRTDGHTSSLDCAHGRKGRFAQKQFHHQKNREKLEQVVAEGTLELGGEQAPEATERSHWPAVGWVCVVHFLVGGAQPTCCRYFTPIDKINASID